MKFALFYHSLLSDWNHGNAHFLRGIATELIERGHEVTVYEPADAWSRQELIKHHGLEPITAFLRAYPTLYGASRVYDQATLEIEEELDDVDVVIVHEWSDHGLVERLGELRRQRGDMRLLFHDTHHRAATQPETMAAYDLAHYDGALVFGEALRQLYLERAWARQVWTWHEAADTRVFGPLARPPLGDVVWIGNWGDDERTAELYEYLLEPVEDLNLKARIHGVRYPESARATLKAAGISFGAWLPNFLVPEVFARFGVTVHVPRRPYVEDLPGIPTIRPFEALACGIPLVTSPWDDAENLFAAGEDYLLARDGAEMKRHLRSVLHDPDLSAALRKSGLATIREHHTCAHRVDELMLILSELAPAGSDASVFRTNGASASVAAYSTK